MKCNLLFLTLALLGYTLKAQNTVIWSDSIVVASTPQPITAPRIVLLKDGTPLITWGVSGNFVTTTSQIWCSRFEGGAFSTPVGVLPDPMQPSLFGFGGYDVAVSDSQVFVVFEQTQQGISLSRSDDGGISFQPPNLVQAPISGGYATLASVGVDGTGNPIVSYIRDKNGATYQIRRSTDSGITFQDPVEANTPAPGGAVCECCTSDLLTSGDSVWLLFRNNNQDIRDIWVSRSTDLAASFDTATDVDNTDWNLNACPIAGPRMARSGDSLMTVWMSGASGVGRVYLSTLHAGTMQIGQQIAFPDSGPLVAQSLPDVSTSGDTVGVVFSEKSKEILFHYSVNGVSNLANQSKRFAIPNHTLQYPSIAFRDGIFHLIYADATSDKVLYRQGRLTQNSPTHEHTEALPMVISPNPTEGALSISAGDNSIQEVILSDAQGKQIERLHYPEVSSNKVSLDLYAYPSGIYFIRISTPDRFHFAKIIKS